MDCEIEVEDKMGYNLIVKNNIKATLIITSEEKISGRFRKMILEANKGSNFRVFKDIVEAENWIIN